MGLIELNSPFEATLVGLTNLYSSYLGVSKLETSQGALTPELVNNSKFPDFLNFCIDKGFLKVSFPASEYDFDNRAYKGLLSISQLATEIDAVEEVLSFDVDNTKDHPIFKSFGFLIDSELGFLASYVSVNTYRQATGLSKVTFKVTGYSAPTAISRMPYVHYLTQLGFMGVHYDLTEEQLAVANTSAFLEISKAKGFYGKDLISFADKRAEMKRLGLVKGSIVFLYKRSKYVNLLDRNIVESCKIAKVVGVTERKVIFQTYQIKDTYEQKWLDFCELPENVQEMYVQFTEFAPYVQKPTTFEVPWDSLGVSYLLNNDSHFAEQYFVTPLTSIYPAQLTFINEEGEYDVLHCSTVDGVLYLLKTYGIRFSEKQFFKQYGKRQVELITSLAKNSIKCLIERVGYDFRKG